MSFAKCATSLLLVCLSISTGVSGKPTMQECNIWEMEATEGAIFLRETVSCDAMKSSLICSIRSIGIEVFARDSVVKATQDELDKQRKQLYNLSDSCNINVAQLVQSVRDGTAPPSGPPRGGSANSKEMSQFKSCLNTWFEAVKRIKYTQQFCPPMNEYWLCSLDAFNVDLKSATQDYKDHIQMLLDQQAALLKKAYNIVVYCAPTLQSLTEDQKTYQWSGNGAALGDGKAPPSGPPRGGSANSTETYQWSGNGAALEKPSVMGVLAVFATLVYLGKFV